MNTPTYSSPNEFAHNVRLYASWSIALLLVLMMSEITSMAQVTSFSYQGKLSDSGSSANGNYDFQFTLWDLLTGGTQQPQGAPVTVTKNGVAVSAGTFTVQLDFGVVAFPGADRFLEISVRPTGGGSFTILAPRQQISSAPYAIRTLKAGSADSLSSSCVACVQDSQINSVAGSKVNGAIPVVSVPGGSGNYIQNTTTQQPSSSFNISGSGFVAGLMGIGTTAPAARLDVQSSAIGFRAISATSTSGEAVRAFSSTSTGVLSTGGLNGVWGVSTGGVGVQGQTGLNGVKGGIAIEAVGTSFFQGDTTPLSRTVAPAGTGVVIGTSPTPDVGYIFSYDYGAGVAKNLALNSPGGFVGIGTSTPQSGLHVNGTGWFTGNNTPLPLAAGPGVGIGFSGSSGSGFLFGYDYSAGNALPLKINGPGGLTTIGGPLELLSVNFTADFPLCWYGFTSPHVLGLCNSSSLRYKKDLQPFKGGLDIVKRLQPISFTWKDRPRRDIGLGAEDVEAIEPLLSFRNDKGEIEGVKYEKLSVVLINAIKEQQAQIEQQQQQINALKRLTCRTHPHASVCK